MLFVCFFVKWKGPLLSTNTGKHFPNEAKIKSTNCCWKVARLLLCWLIHFLIKWSIEYFLRNKGNIYLAWRRRKRGREESGWERNKERGTKRGSGPGVQDGTQAVMYMWVHCEFNWIHESVNMKQRPAGQRRSGQQCWCLCSLAHRGGGGGGRKGGSWAWMSKTNLAAGSIQHLQHSSHLQLFMFKDPLL